MGRKPKIDGAAVRAKAYPLMADAVEAGALLGWRRAHKHTDKPSEDHAVDAIAQAVLSEINDRFDFDIYGE